MMGKDCGRTLRGRMLIGSTAERSTTLTLLILSISVACAGNLLAQNLNAIAVSPTDVIGPSLPTVQRPIRGIQATMVGGMKYRIRFGQEIVVGYAATEISVQSQGKFAADRDLVFRFRGVDGEVYPPRRNLVVDVPVSVEQGTTSQIFIRYLPRWAITRKVSIDVLEDGRVIPELAAEIDLPPDSGMNPKFQRGSSANLRYSAIAMQSENRLDALMLIGTDKPTEAESGIWTSLSRLFELPAQVHPVSRMPTDWRAYQRFDAVFLSASLCEQLSLHPDGLTAFRHWLMMGGTVVVTGDTDPAAIMAEIGVSNVPETILEEQVVSVAADLKSYWSQSQTSTELVLAELAAELANPTSVPIDAGSVGRLNFDVTVSLEGNIDRLRRELHLLQEAQSRTPKQWSQRIWIRPIAAGQVVGLLMNPESETIEESDFDVIEGLIGFRMSPMLRRGVDPMIGDSRFRDWLIPGVAQPPVYTFIGLLTAFVILVGPVAYRQTARHHRSHLMFLIAPVLAIITTAMMFAYGIVSDGFGTMARIRQLTLVDGTSATGVDRIRSTYFAGVRPAEGLRFGGGEEVMAYPETQRIAWSDHLSDTPQAIGKITIAEDGQRLDSSFLPSRSQAQFVVHRPVPNIGSLRVEMDDDGSVMLTNEFDFPLRRIVLRRSEKEYLAVAIISPGSTSKANNVDAKELSKKLGSLYNDFRPIQTISNESRKYQNSGKTVDLLREVMQSVAPRNATYDGLFELAYRDCLQTRLEIPVGHFVAISDISEDVIAVAETEQVGCVRYIMGTFVEQESP